MPLPRTRMLKHSIDLVTPFLSPETGGFDMDGMLQAGFDDKQQVMALRGLSISMSALMDCPIDAALEIVTDEINSAVTVEGFDAVLAERWQDSIAALVESSAELST